MKHNGFKVAIYDPSDSGGITHYTFQLAEGLTQIGCQVTVITSESYELKNLKREFAVWHLFKASRVKLWVAKLQRAIFTGAVAEAPSVSLGAAAPSGELSNGWVQRFKTLRFALVLLKAIVILYFNGTRLVHFQWLVDRQADLWFLRALRLLGFKIVYTVHDLLPHDEYTAENRAYYQELYQYPHRLILHSENNRKEMLELFRVDPDKLTVIPHGCQRLFFDHFAISATAARAQLGIPDGTRVILFFGLIKRYKGLEYLLEAFESIRARCDNVMLLIAGKIYEGDGELFDDYTKLLAQFKDRQDIKFNDEYIPLHQVSRYFAAADLVVLPYVKASQSGVLLSAYAAGKPVIVTDTGGLAEVVKNGQSGFVVPPKNAEAIADAAVKLLTNPDLCRQVAHEAKLLAETTYSWSEIADKTVELYRSLGFVRTEVSPAAAKLDRAA